MSALLTLMFAILTQEPSMPFRAGFAEVEITPPVGTPMQGSNSKTTAKAVLDPLHVRAAVFEKDGERFVIVQLDTALILAAETAAIRKKVEAVHKVPGDRVMVAATHNHAGPALINEALPRDEAYVESMIARCAEAVGKALAARREAEVGLGTAFEFEVAYNRRILMRDGTVSLSDFEASFDPGGFH